VTNGLLREQIQLCNDWRRLFEHRFRSVSSLFERDLSIYCSCRQSVLCSVYRLTTYVAVECGFNEWNDGDRWPAARMNTVLPQLVVVFLTAFLDRKFFGCSKFLHWFSFHQCVRWTARSAFVTALYGTALPVSSSRYCINKWNDGDQWVAERTNAAMPQSAVATATELWDSESLLWICPSLFASSTSVMYVVGADFVVVLLHDTACCVSPPRDCGVLTHHAGVAHGTNQWNDDDHWPAARITTVLPQLVAAMPTPLLEGELFVSSRFAYCLFVSSMCVSCVLLALILVASYHGTALCFPSSCGWGELAHHYGY